MKIDSNKFLLTVITPTIGRSNLDRLVESIDSQTISNKIFHLIMWDEYRESGSKMPENYNSERRWSINLPWGMGKNGSAPGSPLRAVGLNACDTPYVTFADDDVIWKEDHAERMLNAVEGKNWACCLRNMYSPSGEYFGVDRFESVGDSPERKVPYELLDGNTMIFKREFGLIASQFYRSTQDRNDDRLLYAFLKENAGELGRTNKATINHICPEFLVNFFKENCTL
jgi:hypothetical protein